MDRVPPWLRLAVAWLLLGAALFAAWLGSVVNDVLCEQGCNGTLATVRTLVAVLPLVGLLPAMLLVGFTIRRRWTWALGALLAGLAIYGVWGWTLELLTHPGTHGL